MIEKEKDLTCQKGHNNQSIVSLLKNGNLPASQRLLCATCIAELQNQFTAISFNQAKNLIQQKHEKLQETLSESVILTQEKLQQFKGKVDTHKSNIILLFDSLIKNTEEWSNNLFQFQKQKSLYSIFDGIEMLNESMKDQEEKLRNQFYSFNYSYFKKLENMFQLDSLFKNIFFINEAIIGLHIEISSKRLQTQQLVQVQENDETDTPFLAINCKKHHKEIVDIDLRTDIKKEERLKCINCKRENTVSVLEFSELWNQYNNDKLDIIQEYKFQQIKRLGNIKNELQTFIIDLAKIFSDTYLFLDKSCCQSIQNTKQDENSSEIQLIDMTEELSQIKNGLKPKIASEENKEQTLTKLSSLIQYLKSQFATFQVELEESMNYRIINVCKMTTASVSTNSKIQYLLIGEPIKQEYCKAISFNHDDTNMATASNNEIKIWKFNNGIMETVLANLQGHTSSVYCLVSSKCRNWIASGSHDNTIRLWKDMGNNQWQSSEPVKVHTNIVRCLAMSEEENQLTSGSDDKSIKIWKINFETNQLTYEYSLDKHQSGVWAVSLNESETTMVSRSEDYQIIIWGKGKNQQWEFQDMIKNSFDSQGQRICLFNDKLAALQQQSYVQIFQQKKGKFIERSELKVYLKQTLNDGDNQFPTIYNKKRKLLIQKHNRHVYIIRQHEDETFQNECDPIDCKSIYSYGGLTNDGQFLVLWYNEFRVYKLIYE